MFFIFISVFAERDDLAFVAVTPNAVAIVFRYELVSV